MWWRMKIVIQFCWNDSNVSNNLIKHLVFCCTGTRFNPCNKTATIPFSSSVSGLEVVFVFNNAGKAEQAAAIACEDCIIIDSVSRPVFFFFYIWRRHFQMTLTSLLISIFTNFWNLQIGIFIIRLNFIWKIIIYQILTFRIQTFRNTIIYIFIHPRWMHWWIFYYWRWLLWNWYLWRWF